MPTRILLVDSHRVVLEGLRAMLEREFDFEVIGIAEDGYDAVSMVEQLSPDVVVTDIQTPQLNGADACRQIRDQSPETKVLALSVHSQEKFIRTMLDAGASGYVTKDTAPGELLQAIRSVDQGRMYLSSDITDTVVEGFIHQEVKETAADTVLGGREREVLQLIAEGLTSGEIADKMNISTNTVDTHRRNIMKKLDLHSVAELTKYAIREGLSSLDN